MWATDEKSLNFQSRRAFLATGGGASLLLLAEPAKAQLLLKRLMSGEDKESSSPLSRYSDRKNTKIEFNTMTPPNRLSAGRASQLVNKVRQARGRPKISYNRALASAARQQISLMIKSGQFSHRPKGGRSVADRARSLGYKGLVAENLARHFETFEDVLHAWLNSPDHRTSLLSERYRRFGTAAAKLSAGAKSDDGYYWAIVLGT